jgi:2-polyprenyl-3-methyl-5-hydroxy-6-metoxy-1,4-benzoquinol methylase
MAFYLLRNFSPFVGYPYEGEAAPCNLCGSRDTVTICRYDRRLKRLTTVACGQCGLLRTDPMPTDAELARYYAVGYRLDYQLSIGKPPRFHLKRSRRAAAARMKILAPVVAPGKAVLDFGSGSGEFIAAAAEAGLEAVGIEPGRTYAAFARKAYGVEVINEPWQRVNLPEGKFDIITTHHVLEHLNRPVDAMRALARWLKDDGVLYISVPDLSPRPRKQAFELFHFAHVYGFTPRTLAMAARRAGLEPDPRFPAQGTTMVYRKRPAGETAAAEAAAERDPDFSPAELPALYPGGDPVRHLVSGRWIADMVRRMKKDLRDTLAAS